MNKFIFTAILTATATAAFSQNIIVSYESSAPSLATNRDIDKTKMSLIAGPEGSVYYNETSLFCDSLTSTPEGKKRLSEIQMAAWMTQTPDGGIAIDMTRGNAPKKTVYTYIIKDFLGKTMTVYGKWADEESVYDEPMSEMEWAISGDSTCNILGYECVMATTDYHGRHWKAWFAPEIPVSDGPWKFHGLPGIILQAENKDGFIFKATGIQHTATSLPKIYQSDSYRRVDRRKALADNEHFIKNKDAIVSAKYGVKVNHIDKNGNSVKKKEYDRNIHSIELDF